MEMAKWNSEGERMTFDALRASLEELGIDSMKEPGLEETALEIEPTTEDLELEKPEVPNAEDFESNDDPVRLYLHEIGRVPLLKGNDEISELGFKFNSMFNRLKKSDETIFSLANYDTLTGLSNRKNLLENIGDLLENEKEKLAFLFIA